MESSLIAEHIKRIRLHDRDIFTEVDDADYLWLKEFTWYYYPLGRYNSEEAAARAWNSAARRYFGEFAKLNVIPPREQQGEVPYGTIN